MQPGIWTSYLIDDDPERMVETFAARGWTQLELSTEHGEMLLDRGDPDHTGRAFRTLAAGRGVCFPQGHLWLTADITAADGGRTVDALRRWLDLYAAAGVRAAVLHPSGVPAARETRPAGEVLERQVAALGALAAHLAGTDTVICLENVSAAPLAPDLLRLIEAVGSRHLAICLDTGHLHIAGGDQAAFIRAAGAHLKALHIADNEGQTDQHLMPWGRGTVDWPAVVHALRQLPYAGLFNLEIPGENRAPRAVRLAKLDYLKELLRLMLDGKAPPSVS
ncbi:MAG: sugar phosphate isomerase/epimerase [Gemmatimonadota bacterium]